KFAKLAAAKPVNQKKEIDPDAPSKATISPSLSRIDTLSTAGRFMPVKCLLIDFTSKATFACSDTSADRLFMALDRVA
ncbi:MAG: hypothetical protein EBX68_11655, partial [Betaproteobacteria bacterium]|nr:hypothetical protein [Betaproteobacteria bacterium]